MSIVARGAYSFVACLSAWTIGHASLWRRSIVPTPNRHHQHLGGHYVVTIYYIYFVFAKFIPFLFRRLWPPSISQDSDRYLAAILCIKLLHVTFVHFPHLTHPGFPTTFHILLLCEFYSLLLCHETACVHLLLPPPAYWYTSFFFVAGPGHLHENRSFSVFAKLGRANTFLFLSVRLIPRIPLHVSPIFTLLLAGGEYSIACIAVV